MHVPTGMRDHVINLTNLYLKLMKNFRKTSYFSEFAKSTQKTAMLTLILFSKK